MTSRTSCLDEDDRDPLAGERPQQLAQRRRLGRIHPGGRLVEDEQPGLGGKGARELEPPLVAVRELAREGLGARREAHPLEQSPRADRRAAANESAELHVLEHGQSFEQPDRLERPGDPTPRELVGAQPHDVRIREADRAAVGAEVARDEIDQRGLPRPVRADEPEHLPLCDGEVDRVHRHDAAEALGEQRGLKQHLRPPRCGAARCVAARTPSSARAAGTR